MRHILPFLTLCLLATGCGRGEKQAAALDRAAEQSDPAAAAELRNQADAIRSSDSDANVADPNSPAQNALQTAGNAAARSPSNVSQP